MMSLSNIIFHKIRIQKNRGHCFHSSEIQVNYVRSVKSYNSDVVRKDAAQGGTLVCR